MSLNYKNTFSKKERVKSKKEISRIFKDGIFFYSEHINVKIIESNDTNQALHKIGISVPKRLFKLAVHRNKIKRIIREAYRLNKNIIYKNTNFISFNLFFIYKSKETVNFQHIEYEVISLLNKIKNHKKF